MTTSLQRAKVYRNIDLRQQWFGLEVLDALALIFLLVPLIVLNKQGVFWNALVLLVAYVGLRVLKRGKPEGWTTSVIRHYVRPPFYSAAAPDVIGAAHPFPEWPGREVPGGPASTRAAEPTS